MVIVSLGDGVPGNVYCLLHGAPMGGESFVSFEESTSLKWRLSTRPVVACHAAGVLLLCLFLTEAPDNGWGKERRGRKRMGRVGRLATYCLQGRDRSAGTTMTP